MEIRVREGSEKESGVGKEGKGENTCIQIYFVKISIIPCTALATQYKERLTSVTTKTNKRTKLSYDRLTWLLLLILETNNTISNH